MGNLTKRITLNWIKAHNQHEGNERADQMANIAANCNEEMLPVPISLKLFKTHIKQLFMRNGYRNGTLILTNINIPNYFFPS